MKVIFLDVDGVLNTSNGRCDMGLYCLLPTALANLKDIVDKTNASIVLSSTWRIYDEALEILKRKLQELGLDIYAVTPRLGRARWHEIKSWLANHPYVTKYAIIDDDPYACRLDDQPMMFMTNDTDGLTPEIAAKVIEYLGQETP